MVTKACLLPSKDLEDGKISETIELVSIKDIESDYMTKESGIILAVRHNQEQIICSGIYY